MISVRHVLSLSLLLAACAAERAPQASQTAPTTQAPAADPGASTGGPGPTAGGDNGLRSTPGTLPMPAPSPAGKPGTITVVEASYGHNCKAAAGNVTNYLAAVCNGHATCDYKVDYIAIGDPAMGCGKEYVATWHCGDAAAPRTQTAPAEAGYGAVVKLTCAK